jgi:hypothetical protein
MPEVAELWKEALPAVRNGVTGVGVWAALNASIPIAIEDGTFVLGLASKDSDLSGHLKMHQTKRLIESEMSRRAGTALTARIIDGVGLPDWERVKKRDLEAARLKEQSESRVRAEIAAKTNWDGIYEQLSRRYAAIPNKSLPQNRAKFFRESIDVVAEAVREQPERDDVNERNFARCLERIAQYSEVPSTLVAVLVMEKAGND